MTTAQVLKSSYMNDVTNNLKYIHVHLPDYLRIRAT